MYENVVGYGESYTLLLNPFKRYYFNVAENIDFFCQLYTGAGIRTNLAGITYLLLDIGVKPGFSIGLSKSIILEAGIGISEYNCYYKFSNHRVFNRFEIYLNSFSLGLMFKL